MGFRGSGNTSSGKVAGEIHVDTAATPADRLGTTVLRSFRLIEIIGAGSFATAFLAEQLGTDRKAVVKVTHAHLVAGPTASVVKRRFEDELRALTRVRHPNLVTVYLAGETDDGLPALAMEHVEGNTIGEMLEVVAGPMSTEMLRPVFLQIGSAVRTLHSAGIVHRDIAPSNIIISIDSGGTPEATLLDLGVAQLQERAGAIPGAVGTPRYVAPEQMQGHAMPASDLYALGAILWWALTGEELEPGTSGTDPRRLRSELPNSVAELMVRMLSSEPSERPSAEEFVATWPDLVDDVVRARSPRPVHLVPGPMPDPVIKRRTVPPPPSVGPRRPQLGKPFPPGAPISELPPMPSPSSYEDVEAGSGFDLETIDSLISKSPTGEVPVQLDDEPAPPPAAPAEPLPVILVDDNAFTQRFVDSYLKHRDVEVVTTADDRVDDAELRRAGAVIVSGHLGAPGPRAIIDKIRQRRADINVIVTVRSDIGEQWRTWGVRELVSVTGNLGRLGELLDDIRIELTPEPPAEPPPPAVDSDAVLSLAKHDSRLMLDTIELFIGQFPEWHAALEASISTGDTNAARSACKQIEDAVGILGAKSLGHQAHVVRTLVDEGEISMVGGFVERMEAGDAEALEHSHSIEAIRERIASSTQHSYLGDFVLGAVDGSVTTFAVVAGAAGANLSGGVALVLGLANLIADGLSMAGRSVFERQERPRDDRPCEAHRGTAY